MVDSNTLALFHFDDDVYTEVVSPSQWSAIGNSQLDTTDSKFGAGCLYNSSSSNGGIRCPYDPRFDFGTGDFTIDFWWKQPTSGSAYSGGGGTIYGGTVNGTFLIHYLDSGNTVNFGISYQGYPSGASGFRTTDGEWHHHALVRASGVAYFFLDGILKGSQADINSYNSTSSDSIYIFSQNGSNIAMGYFDEFRISNIARWTSDFTPPIYPYGTNFAFLVNNNLYTGASLTNLTNNWNGLTNAEKEALVPSFSSEIPSIQDLSSISPFRVLTDDTSQSNVKVTGQPKPQTIEPTSLINTGSVSTVQSINITNTITDATVKFAITTDLTTYKVYDATQGEWIASTNIEEDGMSIAQINALTPQILGQLDISNGIAFKQCFIATSENASAELSEISAVVDIDGSWSQSVHGTDYSVVYPNKTTMSVRLLTNGDYIINYPISSSS